MSDHGTAIQWTHIPGYKGETWNPVTGCDRVSPGCAHCYALDLAAKLKSWGQPRYQKDGDPKASGPGFGVTLHEDKLFEPLLWKAPRGVFVNSMSDVFHDAIPSEFIAQMFGVMAAASQHVFMVLTKRPERMAALFADPEWRSALALHRLNCGDEGPSLAWPIPNVWLGVTIENRRFVHRADLLRETPAAVRFISAEPLLGPLVLEDFDRDLLDREWEDGSRVESEQWEVCKSCGNEAIYKLGQDGYCVSCPTPPTLDLTDIDWLITGGESGPQHRRFDQSWALDLQRECNLNGTAFFHKQNGGRRAKEGGRLLDGRTYDEFPAVPA